MKRKPRPLQSRAFRRLANLLRAFRQPPPTDEEIQGLLAKRQAPRKKTGDKEEQPWK
jgi:hypothetical protein